jgi:hypothetical protein
MEMESKVYSNRGVDVYYYNYKEPFIKFKGGFGFLGAVGYSRDKDKVQCAFCGEFFGGIRQSHLEKCVGVKKYEKKYGKEINTLDDYRDVCGLSKSTVLIGEITREKMISRKLSTKALEVKKKWASEEEKERRRLKLIENNKKRKGSKARMEIKNKTGTCPVQLLDRIKKVKKAIGRTPSKRDFYKFYKGKYLGAIYSTYGSYIEAVRLSGLTPQSDLYKGNFKYTNEQLIEFLQRFVLLHKRLSTYSDHERGLLPAYDTYIKRFGSINNARREAGLPAIYRIKAFECLYDFTNCDDKFLPIFNENNNIKN